MGALALFESALKQVRVFLHLNFPVEKNSSHQSAAACVFFFFYLIRRRRRHHRPLSFKLNSTKKKNQPQAPTAPEAAAASWNATVVHCSFGDVELAQITLRDALAAGLDFERALTAEGRRVTGARVDEIRASVADNDASVAAREGSGPGGDGGGGGDPSAALRLPFAGSPQVASQLRKFAKNFARASSLAASATPSYSSSPSSSSPSSSSPISVDGIDASPAAIAKRVAVLLAVLLGLGVGLYLYGLQYLYPSTS